MIGDFDFDFDFDENDVITTPGKFEGEPRYAPSIYAAILNGLQDSRDNEYGERRDFVLVTKSHRKAFPELNKVYAVEIYISKSGFCYSVPYTEAEYRAEIEALENENIPNQEQAR